MINVLQYITCTCYDVGAQNLVECIADYSTCKYIYRHDRRDVSVLYPSSAYFPPGPSALPHCNAVRQLQASVGPSH